MGVCLELPFSYQTGRDLRWKTCKDCLVFYYLLNPLDVCSHIRFWSFVIVNEYYFVSIRAIHSYNCALFCLVFLPVLVIILWNLRLCWCVANWNVHRQEPITRNFPKGRGRGKSNVRSAGGIVLILTSLPFYILPLAGYWSDNLIYFFGFGFATFCWKLLYQWYHLY